MKSWEHILVRPESAILNAVKVLNDYCQFVIVVDDRSRLLGTITDGDVRRGILNGFDLNKDTSADIMNKTPFFLDNSLNNSQILNELQGIDAKISFVPLIDRDRVVTGVYSISDISTDSALAIPVVVMAGGLGSRLGEMTKTCPKPMLPINGTPILELILNDLKKRNFNKFYFSVNYKSEVIEDYFGDGTKHGVEINYIRESKKMGTAGSLSLVEFDCDNVLVVNGDVLTQVNFQGLLDFHLVNKSDATMCVREYSYTIPYGVVTAADGIITEITEKPSTSFFVNAGIYVLSTKVLKLIPNDEYFDMTTLFKKVMDQSMPCMVYPVHEYWADIGQKEDFLKAQENPPKIGRS